MPKGDKTEEIEGFVEMPTGEEVPEETPEVVPETPETPEETPEITETPEETPEKPEETPEVPEVTEEPEKFEFADTPEEPEKPFMVVKHQGKEVSIKSEEDARNYIQKGFDYDFKVGPHKKLAQIMDEYPDFAKKVASDWDSFVAGKDSVTEPSKKPELKSLDDFENPNDWFWENYSKVREHEKSSQVPAPPPPRQEVPSWVSAMVTHDPQNFNKIAPLVPQYAEKYLTKSQYDRVNNDLPSLVQFYDWVKGQVTQTPIKETPPVETPSFRVQSGGGEAPSADEKPPWENMNNDKFEEYMAGIKGVASY